MLAVLGISTFTFAGLGGWYGHGMGAGMMDSGMMGTGWQQGGGYYGIFSSDEIAKLDQRRRDFFQATENIRQQLYEKNLA